MTMRWKLVDAMGPVLRALPWWVRVRAYHKLIGDPFRNDAVHGHRVVPVAPHGYLMNLDLADWMERFAAVTGIYYELEAIATIGQMVRPGDTFVDVGGNIGFTSLTAAHAVGADGKVFYCEPNPELIRRFEETKARNHLAVEVVPCAIGAEEGEVALETTGHHGVTHVKAGSGSRVITGDSLAIPADRACFVKIDVEGYEAEVLKGMTALHARDNVAFLIEVTDGWLRREGSSAAAMFDLMASAGYAAYRPHYGLQGLSFSKLAAPASEHQYDVLFVRAGMMAERLSA